MRLTERVRHQIASGRRGVTMPSGPARARTWVPSVGTGGAKAGDRASPGLVLIGDLDRRARPRSMSCCRNCRRDFPWPVLIAQHLPASFTGAFARRLDRECQLAVVEVNQPMLMKPGTIYIGKGDADVMVAPRGQPVSSPCRRQRRPIILWHPSVERMVASALDHLNASQLIGVMMTGMGNDGAEAMKRLRLAGGRTIAEAEFSAIVWGMPGELVKNGGAEKVRPLDDIAATIIDMVSSHAPG